VPSLTVRFRARAASDIDDAVDHYQREAGEAVALDFIESVSADKCPAPPLPATGQMATTARIGPSTSAVSADSGAVLGC
jgi:plasmid stabilization system protein ParE